MTEVLGPGANVDGTDTCRLKALWSMCFGKLHNADAGAEALNGMGFLAHDDFDQGLGIRANFEPAWRLMLSGVHSA